MLVKDLEELRLELAWADTRVGCLERRISELANTIGRERQLLVRVKAQVEELEERNR